MSKYQVPIKLRPPTQQDLNFILDSWLRSYRLSGFAKPQCNRVYFTNQQLLIKGLLSDSLTTVACNPEDENQIYGYIVFDYIAGSVLNIHYTYVKETFRRLKIATRMLESVKKTDDPILYTHHTRFCNHLKDSSDFIYDPYSL